MNLFIYCLFINLIWATIITRFVDLLLFYYFDQLQIFSNAYISHMPPFPIHCLYFAFPNWYTSVYTLIWLAPLCIFGLAVSVFYCFYCLPCASPHFPVGRAREIPLIIYTWLGASHPTAHAIKEKLNPLESWGAKWILCLQLIGYPKMDEERKTQQSQEPIRSQLGVEVL